MINKLNSQDLTISAIIISSFFIETMNLNDLNSWGNWFQLIGQYLETYAAFETNQKNYTKKAIKR